MITKWYVVSMNPWRPPVWTRRLWNS